MNVALHTLGCKQNYAETSHIRGQFEKAGHTIVEFGEACDVVIINTCTVTDNADVECRKLIRRVQRTSPDAFIGVTGCYAQLQPEEIASVDGVDAVFGASQKFQIPSLIQDFHKLDTPRIFVDDVNDLDFVEATFTERDSRTRAFLKIQDGCDYSCSFCTIPLARGASRSMSIHDVASNVRRLAELGYAEIILTGINLGEYCSPEGARLVDLMRFLQRMQLTLRFRLSSIEPNTLTDEIIELVAGSDNFCKHFHIPMQSGSEDILRSMRRRYLSARYRERIERIRELMPEAGIGADVICGFPGESEAHFVETLNFIDDLPLSYLHVFRYSERDNTPAAHSRESVDIYTRRQRTNILRALSEKKRRVFYHSMVGTTVRVVPESYNRERGTWSGYSDNYCRVEFAADVHLRGSLVSVRLIESRKDAVFGEFCNVDVHHVHPSYIPILV